MKKLFVIVFDIAILAIILLALSPIAMSFFWEYKISKRIDKLNSQLSCNENFELSNYTYGYLKSTAQIVYKTQSRKTGKVQEMLLTLHIKNGPIIHQASDDGKPPFYFGLAKGTIEVESDVVRALRLPLSAKPLAVVDFEVNYKGKIKGLLRSQDIKIASSKGKIIWQGIKGDFKTDIKARDIDANIVFLPVEVDIENVRILSKPLKMSLDIEKYQDKNAFLGVRNFHLPTFEFFAQDKKLNALTIKNFKINSKDTVHNSKYQVAVALSVEELFVERKPATNEDMVYAPGEGPINIKGGATVNLKLSGVDYAAWLSWLDHFYDVANNCSHDLVSLKEKTYETISKGFNLALDFKMDNDLGPTPIKHYNLKVNLDAFPNVFIDEKFQQAFKQNITLEQQITIDEATLRQVVIDFSKNKLAIADQSSKEQINQLINAFVSQGYLTKENSYYVTKMKLTKQGEWLVNEKPLANFKLPEPAQ